MSGLPGNLLVLLPTRGLQAMGGADLRIGLLRLHGVPSPSSYAVGKSRLWV